MDAILDRQLLLFQPSALSLLLGGQEKLMIHDLKPGFQVPVLLPQCLQIIDRTHVFPAGGVLLHANPFPVTAGEESVA